MKKLLLTGANNYSQEQFNKLTCLNYEIIFVPDERVELNFDVSNIDAVVCNNLFLYNDISKFEKLKFVQLTSAGLDRVPLSYIKENNIRIFNAKDVYSKPISEWVILKILEIYKNSKFFYKNQEQHEWKKRRDLLELSDKVVSIVGFGNIGTEIARKLKPFDVKLYSINRRKINSKYIDKSFLIEDINIALQESDIVILTLPLTNETKNIINKNKLDVMKDNAILINVSRGEIVNEDDLIVALENKKFLGVALDVFKKEPLNQSPLWDFQNVIITPHNSFISDKINERLFELIVNNLEMGDL